MSTDQLRGLRERQLLNEFRVKNSVTEALFLSIIHLFGIYNTNLAIFLSKCKQILYSTVMCSELLSRTETIGCTSEATIQK